MQQYLAAISILVHDYDEAIAYYTQVLSFELTSDVDLGGGKRWVVVTPPGQSACGLLLAVASTPEQKAQIGFQSGGRVFLFLHTDDFQRDYETMQARGVTFVEAPRHEVYGTVVIFEDLYGNRWDLIQPAS